jgi:hypothetical protein
MMMHDICESKKLEIISLELKLRRIIIASIIEIKQSSKKLTALEIASDGNNKHF